MSIFQAKRTPDIFHVLIFLSLYLSLTLLESVLILNVSSVDLWHEDGAIIKYMSIFVASVAFLSMMKITIMTNMPNPCTFSTSEVLALTKIMIAKASITEDKLLFRAHFG